MTWARRDASITLRNVKFRDQVATLAAAVREVPKEEIEGEDVRQERRTRRIVRAVIATLTVLVLLTSLLAVVANVQRHEAVIQTQAAIRERDAAISGQLIAESEALGDTNPVLAKQESVAAWQIDPSNPAARYAMLVAARLPGTGILTSGDGASVDSVAYSPDGKILATGSGDGIVRLWDVATQQQIGVPLGNFRLANLIESVAFSPDGKIVAAASQDGVSGYGTWLPTS